MRNVLPVLLIVLCMASTPADAGGQPGGGAGAGERSTPAEAPARSPKPRSWALRILRIIGMLAVIYVCVVVGLFLFRDRLIYHPVRHPGGEWDQPALGVENCTIETADGLRIHAWWRPGTNPQVAPTLLWFHGNAGNVTHRADNLSMLPDAMNVLLVGYRGYGKSQGHPSEKGLYLDGEAAHRFLIEEKGVGAERIISYGRSLGTAVALHVALERPVAGLILESPFHSAGAMARHMFPFVPGRLLLRGMFDNAARIGELKVPLLIIHGKQDRVVPFDQGQYLYDTAPEPKQFLPLPHAGHNDTYLAGGREYFHILSQFVQECTTPPHPREQR